MAQDDVRLVIRVGSTRPPVVRTLVDEDDLPLDLTGATVDAVVVDWAGTEVWRNAAAVDADPTTGTVTYEWRPADTATAGNYGLYFEVTWPDASTGDYPLEGPIDLIVAEPGTADLDPYVVPVSRVARAIGIAGAVPDDIRRVIEDMLLDVQADVEGYLRRPVVPIRVTEAAWKDFTDPTGYRLAVDPVVRVLSAVEPAAGTNGQWTVSYVAGITNPIARRAIARYVLGATVEEFRAHPVYGKAYRSVRSLSAGGRSITYDTPAAASRRSAAQLPAYPQPGSMPSIETLAPWRKRGVFSRLKFAGPEAFGAGQYASGTYLMGPEGEALFFGDARTGEVFPQ